METMLRFHVVEIDSKIFFTGKKRKKLKYAVRSLSLVAKPVLLSGDSVHLTIPEIFWQ
ncbi:MAG: hypothetical protein WCO44_04455 [Bacteroidota bacterium]